MFIFVAPAFQQKTNEQKPPKTHKTNIRKKQTTIIKMRKQCGIATGHTTTLLDKAGQSGGLGSKQGTQVSDSFDTSFCQRLVITIHVHKVLDFLQCKMINLYISTVVLALGA